MSKVAGAQKFDGRNWFEQQIAKRTQAALAAQDAVFAEQHAGGQPPGAGRLRQPVRCSVESRPRPLRDRGRQLYRPAVRQLGSGAGGGGAEFRL